MRLAIAADIGGTFTDLVATELESGETRSFKVFTTYPDRSPGLMAGVDRVVQAFGATHADIAAFVHGSTVATNALVEMKGARCGLITTRGFRDLLELRRQKRPHLYDLQADKPEPIIERRLRLEASERMRADGSVLKPLAEDEVRSAAGTLAAEGVEAIIIAFLHAYANPGHEQRAKAIVREVAPGMPVYTSGEVSPQFREFERLSTTAVNAYVGPVVELYLRNLQEAMAGLGSSVPPAVLKCDGGIASVEEACRAAISTIGSGPSAGVRGAILSTSLAGAGGDLITLDMGGTSTDVSLVVGGRASVADQREVGGWPIKGLATDVESIGAGGGSIAFVDRGGLLQVGPRSAGSTPGPACYGRGGTEPTVTDANVVLGRIGSLVGGEVQLDVEAAREAIETHVATPLGLSVEAAALGILRIATASMEQAIRLMTVEKGRDPRDFLIVAFGGAGPLHAPIVARSLGIRRCFVPAAGGVLSAMGALFSDITKDFSATELRLLNAETVPSVRARLDGLMAAGEAWLAKERYDGSSARRLLSIDMRCRRQNYELSVAVPEHLAIAAAEDFVASMTAAFHAEHERIYGYAFRGVPVECVTYRLRLELPTAWHALPARATPAAASPPFPAPRRRKVLFDAQAGFVATPVVAPENIEPDGLSGPAIVEQSGATVVVLPRQRVRRDTSGALWIEDDEIAARSTPSMKAAE